MCSPFYIDVHENWTKIPKSTIENDGSLFKVSVSYDKGAVICISICKDGKVIIDCNRKEVYFNPWVGPMEKLR